MLWLVKVRVACLEFEQQIEISEDTKRETVVEGSEKQEQGWCEVKTQKAIEIKHERKLTSGGC